MKICFFKLKNHNVLFTFTVTFCLSRQKNNKLKENFRRKLNFLCILKVHVNLYMHLNYNFKQWIFLITQNARNFDINYPSFFIIVCHWFVRTIIVQRFQAATKRNKGCWAGGGTQIPSGTWSISTATKESPTSGENPWIQEQISNPTAFWTNGTTLQSPTTPLPPPRLRLWWWWWGRGVNDGW